MRKPIRVGLIDRQQPFLEWHSNTRRWRIWTHFNKDVTLGSYFDLHPDGTLDQVVQDEAEVTTVRVQTLDKRTD